MRLDPAMFDMERLLKALLSESACLHWRHECEIIPHYVAPYAAPGTRPEVHVRHVPSGCFLRYSAGPRQGHFWDCYGEDYQTPELALQALLEAPPPFWYFRELQPAPRQELPGHDTKGE